MSLRATMASSIQVAAASSQTMQKFSAENGFEEEEKEEEGGKENIEGFVRKEKGFLPMNLPNPKGGSFNIKGIERGRLKVIGLKEKLAPGFSRWYYFGLFQLI